MAFKLQRQKRLVEDIELCNEYGETVKTIHVDLDVEAMAMRINTARNELIRVEQLIKTAETEDEKTTLFERYGEGLVVMLRLVFGDDNTQEIINHFEGRFLEISTEIIPFIQQVVFPAIEKASKERMERLRKNYRPKGGFFGG